MNAQFRAAEYNKPSLLMHKIVAMWQAGLAMAITCVLWGRKVLLRACAWPQAASHLIKPLSYAGASVRAKPRSACNCKGSGMLKG